jgi:hypothetical protein
MADFNAYCSRSDAVNSWGSEPQPPATTAAPTTAAPTTGIFDRIDEDKNGDVSREEFKKALDACMITASGLPCTKKANPSLPSEATFKRLDKNNNNVITEGEFKKAVDAGTIGIKAR